MEKNIKEIFEKSKGVILDAEKKNSIEKEIVLYMKENPKGQMHFISLKTIRTFAVSLLLLFFMGGIAAAKADSSLPGEFLYPMKIGFNERIQYFFAFSKDAKIDLNMKLANKRLEEAEKLAVSGRMNKDNQDQIKENFDNHASKIKKHIDQLNKEEEHQNALKTASDFESFLKAHGHILKEINKKGDVNSLIDNIESAASEFSESRLDSEKKELDDSGNKEMEVFARKLSSAQESMNQLKELISEKRSDLGAKGISQAENNLKLAEKNIEEAKKAFEENNYPLSFSLLEKSKRVIRESQNLIKSRIDLDLDVDIEIED